MQHVAFKSGRRYYIRHVKDACAFIGDGMSRSEKLEHQVHLHALSALRQNGIRRGWRGATLGLLDPVPYRLSCCVKLL